MRPISTMLRCFSHLDLVVDVYKGKDGKKLFLTAVTMVVVFDIHLPSLFGDTRFATEIII